MVPSGFVPVEALPLTVNGKLDRAALAALAAPSANYIAPRTATEARLCEIFAEVLGVERVGASDDFFALGGHSLLAVRAVARLSDVTGRRVELVALFRHPLISAFADYMDGLGDSVEPTALSLNDWLDGLTGEQAAGNRV
jgi:hypothetical protein